MEERERIVVISEEFINDLGEIYVFGVETFGENQANLYENRLWGLIGRLNLEYAMYPECRWLPTQGRIYRNIILDSHLIIFRIKHEKIEVLRAFHSHSSITRIRSARGIRI